MKPRGPARSIGALAAMAVLPAATVLPAVGHEMEDDIRRTAVVSAFAPEIAVLRSGVEGAQVHSVNGV